MAFWSPADEAFLRQHYPEYGAKWVAEQLGRSQTTTKWKAQTLGVAYAHPGAHLIERHYVNRPAHHHIEEKRCAECGDTFTLIHFRYNIRHGKEYLHPKCNRCAKLRREELSQLKTEPPAQASLSATPCDGCPHYRHCARTGDTCLAYRDFERSGKVSKAHRTPTGFARVAA